MTAPPFVGIRRRGALSVARLYARSAISGWWSRADYSDVQAFCLFLGYPRSGSTLLGSLLDAHPDAVISQELDALGFVARGFSRLQLFDLIRANSRFFGEHGRDWTGYRYDVPDQWQGRVRGLRVIGDKKAGRSTRQLDQDPELLDLLRDTIVVPLRVVHVVRNPYDNIATRHKHSRNDHLAQTVEKHFGLCASVAAVRARLAPDELLDVRHEDLVADTRGTLRGVVEFLGLDAPDGYLDAADSVVFSKPRRSRDSVEWSSDDVALVAERAAAYDFLSGYGIED